MEYKKILTIQDISCVGQCSLTVELPILSACGMETCVLPSAVLSTHTAGFSGFTFRDLTDDMPAIQQHWQKEGIAFDGIYTGYLGSTKQVGYVKNILDTMGTDTCVKVVDPAFADNGKLYPIFDSVYVDAMKTLCPSADILLPNITEACFLAGVEYKEVYDEDYVKELLSELGKLGCPTQEIWEVADYIGDSFGLSKKAAEVKEQTVLMCGVHFMAETVKMLSPQKKILLANPIAGCPMADQMDADLITQMKASMSDYTVVAYINTTAELKTVCDVCVTSSSAVKIIRSIPNDKILFIPDCNLGDYIAKQVPEKEIKLVRGGCPTHLRITKTDIERARKNHPAAEILMHPECHPDIVKEADFVGSTTEIMDYAEKGIGSEYIIGTENSIVEHLQYKCPKKSFYPLSKDCVCHNMQATTLTDVYRAVIGLGGEEIVMSDELIASSRKCIDEMLRLGE